MTNEQRKAILDNAPEGATHYDQCEYIRYVEISACISVWECYSKYDNEWLETEPEYDTRNLDDLRAIVEKDERIAELERELETWKKKYIFAERVTDCAERHLHDEHFEFYCDEVEQLRKQAGGL